ncbi:hypothetical protein ACKA01_05005 [Helcococcus kunzii]|uniref:hypothetical protein n=2 Tax=Helcococcus kunzii TaxID=40091 RepID=UPI0038B1F5E4
MIQEYQTEYREQLKNGLEKIGYQHFAACQDHPDRTKRNRVLIASKQKLIKLKINSKIDNYSRRNWNEVKIAINPNKMMIRILGVHVPLAENAQTWEDKKLDYIFVNTKFSEMMKVESGNIKPKNTAYSDHKYFCVELDLERCNY